MAPPDRHESPHHSELELGSSVFDLSQIRLLVESSGVLNTLTCPSCDMPFDKGKKRRLIDACGHERCYSCLFRSESCPLCASGQGINCNSVIADENDDDKDEENDENDTNGGSSKYNPYEYFQYTNVNDTSNINPLCGSLKLRQKSDRVHHHSRHHSDGQKLTCSAEKLPFPLESTDLRRKTETMTQSYPTPPARRKRFFLKPKVPKSSMALYRSAKHHGTLKTQISSSDNSSALSAWMTTSLEGTSRWPGLVLGKIKSLWSTSQGSANDGLNQLINAADKVADDESECTKVLPSKTRKSRSDLHMRLGLLLDNQHTQYSDSFNSCIPNQLEPASNAEQINNSRLISRLQNNNSSQNLESSAASFSSLTSYETQAHTSTNTSPLSTLTGTSSEAERAAAITASQSNFSKIRSKTKAFKSCNNCESFASISTCSPASTSMSMSMSISGLSNDSNSSPVSVKRHSVTTSKQTDESDENAFQNRKACIRRSSKMVHAKRHLTQPKVNFAQHRIRTQLLLKPLFFEVPLVENDFLFVGRQWLLHKLESVILSDASSGVLIFGNPGTGKTALILQLVENSCFGRRRNQSLLFEEQGQLQGKKADKAASSESPKSAQSGTANQNVNESIRKLASYVVAYHFCQADNNSTCLVPDFIHSLAAQLCQTPHLENYREYMLSEPHLQGCLSQRECTVDPDLALSRGIIEPLSSLQKAGRLPNINMVILIDAIGEAEYHKPDRGDTIASFLVRHLPNFPPWLKVVCTVRTQLQDCVKLLPYTKICLDKVQNGDNTITSYISKDLTNYVEYRLTQNPTIEANVTASIKGKTESSHAATQTRFASHLATLAQGSFLFVKLTLDFIESGHLVAKSANYKVLPVSLGQIFLLHFNLKFPTSASFDKVHPILAVCLAALYPLTLSEIFYSVNSLHTNFHVSWENFMCNFKTLSGFLVKRSDDTYMFFHPSFREWLIRRDEGDSTKFLCDLRLGHAAIAFRLSRLETPLDADRGLELGHHVLKAHIYRGLVSTWAARDLQAVWVMSSVNDVSSTFCTLKNIYNPNVKVSRLLLLSGASPNFITNYMGNAPILCMYAHEGSIEMVSLLLEFGADLELSNSQGSTALSLAAARGHYDVVQRLVAAGALLGHTDIAGQCPLIHAAKHGRLSVVEYLLICNWEQNAESAQSRNPESLVEMKEAVQQALVAAASQGHESVVEYLLDMSEVDINSPDTLIGETALTVAAANGSTATVSILATRGANLSAVNAKGLSPLMLAAREGHWGTAEKLLQVSLTMIKSESEHAALLLEQRDLAGRTALMLAASEGYTNLIELFLEKGSILESADKDGITALSWACIRGRISAVQYLLEKGADVQTTDSTGKTPLDWAAFQGNPKLVELLLEKGATMEHVDLHGMRPLDRAIDCRNIFVVQCFLRRGAKLGPSTWAVAADKPDILLILLNKLLEDGNVLYRKSRVKEASYRYAYALRKFPNILEHSENDEQKNQGQNDNLLLFRLRSFTQLKLNFLLNLSRCKRKMNESKEAVDLADQALEIRSTSYEAFYARARGLIDIGFFERALNDIKEALRLAPLHNRQDRHVLTSLRNEIISRMKRSKADFSKE